MLVASYMRGIPANNRNPEKPEIINNFAVGVNRHGVDRGIVCYDNNPINCDVAVIQGYVHKRSEGSPHLNLRRAVLDHQLSQGKRTIIVDSNLFLYKDSGNTKRYLRYSYDGVFPTTGEYCNDTFDPKRWEKLRKDIGFDLQPYRGNKGKYIVICAQRDGGWSMGGKRVVDWVLEILPEIKKYTSKPVMLRFHPGDGNWRHHYKKLIKSGIILSRSKTLMDDLNVASAVVTYNSSPGVAAAIEGIPVFVTDPNPTQSQAYSVANTSLARIENPEEFDREDWIKKLAMCHWNQEDLKSGECWDWMRQWATK